MLIDEAILGRVLKVAVSIAERSGHGSLVEWRLWREWILILEAILGRLLDVAASIAREIIHDRWRRSCEAHWGCMREVLVCCEPGV